MLRHKRKIKKKDELIIRIAFNYRFFFDSADIEIVNIMSLSRAHLSSGATQAWQKC